MKIIIELHKLKEENLKDSVALFQEVEKTAEKYSIVKSIDMR